MADKQVVAHTKGFLSDWQMARKTSGTAKTGQPKRNRPAWW
jgi:hypothetical protein